MTFLHPYYFLLLLVVPLVIYLYVKRQQRPATFKLSTTKAFDGYHTSLRSRLHWLPFALLLVSYTFAIFALARPQSSTSHSTRETEGINIMLVLDVSGSMLARDLQPNRIEAAKAVASEFVASRPSDIIGLVVFAGESYTQCPLTTDHAMVLNLMKEVELGLISDGTAIGSGLATAVSRLKDVEGDSKVVVLLTDGTNNAGAIAPITAAEIAESFGIRVYTIGVGTKGEAPTPVQTIMGIEYMMLPVDIDEGMLQEIAAGTDGRYFRATDNASLKAIYEEIDQMEKVKLKVENFTQKTEHFALFLWLSLGFAAAALLLRNTWLRSLP